MTDSPVEAANRITSPIISQLNEGLNRSLKLPYFLLSLNMLVLGYILHYSFWAKESNVWPIIWAYAWFGFGVSFLLLLSLIFVFYWIQMQIVVFHAQFLQILSNDHLERSNDTPTEDNPDYSDLKKKIDDRVKRFSGILVKIGKFEKGTLIFIAGNYVLAFCIVQFVLACR